MFGRGIGINIEVHIDGVEPIADVGIATEDAEYVHAAFERGPDGPELDAAVLRDRGDARGETAGERGQNGLNGCRGSVLRREALGMIRFEGERLAMALLLAKAREAFNGRAAEGAVDPIAAGAPGELGGLGIVGQGIAGFKQRLAVDAVVDGFGGRGHLSAPLTGLSIDQLDY